MAKIRWMLSNSVLISWMVSAIHLFRNLFV
nr:MAG TPA: hypothetical protein [Microviridae sp.]